MLSTSLKSSSLPSLSRQTVVQPSGSVGGVLAPIADEHPAVTGVDSILHAAPSESRRSSRSPHDDRSDSSHLRAVSLIPGSVGTCRRSCRARNRATRRRDRVARPADRVASPRTRRPSAPGVRRAGRVRRGTGSTSLRSPTPRCGAARHRCDDEVGDETLGLVVSDETADLPIHLLRGRHFVGTCVGHVGASFLSVLVVLLYRIYE